MDERIKGLTNTRTYQQYQYLLPEKTARSYERTYLTTTAPKNPQHIYISANMK